MPRHQEPRNYCNFRRGRCCAVHNLGSTVALLLACWAVIVVVVHAADDADGDAIVQHNSPLLESCRSDGFDPWQLSCDTCELLPTSSSTSSNNGIQNLQERCLECCQSYKSSARMTKPYESAVLVHRESQGKDSEMEQFLSEHWNDLVDLKGAQRLMKVVRDEAASSSPSSRFLFMTRPAPQMVLWFDEVVAPGQKLQDYKDAATEIVTLDGYKKDDMKDMFTTLLPDKY